jgi:hypothetical protein
MQEPEIHYATDRRCYYGAMCSDLQKEHGSKQAVFDQIKAKYPEYSCVYFPYGGFYMNFLGYKQLSPVEYQDRGQCLLAAWRGLIGRSSDN